MELISAIIITHNRARLLRYAIESVLNQTYRNIECIVVDDASVDNTRQICSNYPVHYILIPKDESRGNNYARNMGAKIAKGKYLAYLDDDDQWLPTKIEEQMERAIQTGSSLIYCLRDFYYSLSKKTIKESLFYSKEGDLSNIIYKHYITSTSCLLIEKDVFFQVGGFDEKLKKWQEYELMMRLCQVTNVYLVPKHLVIYLIDDSDKNKLTNIFDIYPISIKYIFKKHRKLMFRNPINVLYYVSMSICEIYKVSKRSHKWKYLILCFPWAFTVKCFNWIIRHKLH